MKALPRLIVAAVLLAVLVVPFASFADQLPLPLEKKVLPGVTTVDYAGQSVRFTTPVALIIRFEPITAIQIRLTVRSYGSSGSGSQQASPASELNIYWENWSNDIYNGPTPSSSSPWTGVLYSESGFTEK